MQSPQVELEHFRELLKYLEDMACLKSILVRVIRGVQAFRGGFRTAFRFLFVQDKPILFFILPWSAMPPSLARARYSSRSETSHGIESAAQLNPFISAENRIIWLMCLPPSSA